MIDCDIHPQLGDPEEGLLPYIEPAQRDWFRLQGPTLGLPGYPWNHPTSFFRQDLDHEEAQPPSSTVAEVVRDVLDPFGVDVGVLNGDDGIYVSLVASPYRAAEFARAHNDWIREQWLDAEPRLRGGIVCAAQDPLAAAAEIRRVADDPRFVHVVADRRRPSGRTASRATCRSSRRPPSAGCPSRSTPAARAWASRRRRAAPACRRSTSSGTRSARPAASWRTWSR